MTAGPAPTAAALMQAMEATWPAAGYRRLGPWQLRSGAGGGKRVSATTARRDVGEAEIDAAEAAMNAAGQPLLFSLGPAETALDAALARRGYDLVDPVSIYAAPLESIALRPGPADLPASRLDLPLDDSDRALWAEGGVGPGRIAVMMRAAGPKSVLAAPEEGRPGGLVFVALRAEIAMIHSLFVAPGQRRRGLARGLVTASARWAADAGARWLALAVTDANLPANRLYAALGMTVRAHYHYRAKH